MGINGWRTPHVIPDEVPRFVDNPHPGHLIASGGWCAPRSALDALGITITDQETPMNEPRTYVKKPVAIEAIQWDGTADGAASIINWILTGTETATYIGVGDPHPLRRDDEMVKDEIDGKPVAREDAPAFLVIQTLEGSMRADALDYVIRGVQGEFYPCKPDIFDATYEEQA